MAAARWLHSVRRNVPTAILTARPSRRTELGCRLSSHRGRASVRSSQPCPRNHALPILVTWLARRTRTTSPSDWPLPASVPVPQRGGSRFCPCASLPEPRSSARCCGVPERSCPPTALEARARSRERLEAGAGELLAAPEVERAVDQALAGPLTDSVARSLAKHRVAERVAAEIAATPEFEQAVADALDHEATQRLVDRALASPGLERLVIEALESRLTRRSSSKSQRAPPCVPPCSDRPRRWPRS